jgi:Gpi18-like mannosyltransferase
LKILEQLSRRVSAGLLLLLRALHRVTQARSVRAAFFVFALTRTIVFVVFLFATHLTFDAPPPQDSGSGIQNMHIVIFSHTIRAKVSSLALRGDSGWYIAVAKKGYEKIPFNTDKVHDWAFFPLYPLLLRLAAALTGGFLLTGMILSNLFLLLALVLLHQTVTAFGHDEATAYRTIFYLAACPTSYFFSLPMTESLFLLLTVGSLWAAKRDSWWLAGAFGALASATRYNGLFLLPVLAVMYWQGQRPFKLRANILALCLLPLGLLAFMFYLFLITGNAFAFLGIQKAWGVRSGFFLYPLYNYLIYYYEISILWNFRLLNFMAAIIAFACGFALLKRREWALAFYTFISVIIPLSTLNLLRDKENPYPASSEAKQMRQRGCKRQ